MCAKHLYVYNPYDLVVQRYMFVRIIRCLF